MRICGYRVPQIGGISLGMASIGVSIEVVRSFPMLSTLIVVFGANWILNSLSSTAHFAIFSED